MNKNLKITKKVSYVRAKRATFGNISMSLLKEIGILKDFVARKSEKIDEIENMFHKRHLPISLQK